jgi:hypothetical protein
MEIYMKKTFLFTIAMSLVSMSAMAAKPVFYPSAPDQPRVQFLKSINGSSFFIGGNGYGNRFPGYEMPDQKETDPIGKPYGVAVTPGKVYVCDTGSSVVKVFDLEKKICFFYWSRESRETSTAIKYRS